MKKIILIGTLMLLCLSVLLYYFDNLIGMVALISTVLIMIFYTFFFKCKRK